MEVSSEDGFLMNICRRLINTCSSAVCSDGKNRNRHKVASSHSIALKLAASSLVLFFEKSNLPPFSYQIRANFSCLII